MRIGKALTGTHEWGAGTAHPFALYTQLQMCFTKRLARVNESTRKYCLSVSRVVANKLKSLLFSPSNSSVVGARHAPRELLHENTVAAIGSRARF